VMRPVDADVVDLVLAVAQLHNTVDHAPRVGGQRSLRRLIRSSPTPDCSSPGSDRPALTCSVHRSGRGSPLPPRKPQIRSCRSAAG
jgi:hypothetical protein